MAFSQIDEFLLDKVHLWLESPGTRAEEKLVCPKQTKSARQAELTGRTGQWDFLCSFGNLKNDQQNESRGKNVSPALNTLTCGQRQNRQIQQQKRGNSWRFSEDFESIKEILHLAILVHTKTGEKVLRQSF